MPVTGKAVEGSARLSNCGWSKNAVCWRLKRLKTFGPIGTRPPHERDPLVRGSRASAAPAYFAAAHPIGDVRAGLVLGDRGIAVWHEECASVVRFCVGLLRLGGMDGRSPGACGAGARLRRKAVERPAHTWQRHAGQQAAGHFAADEVAALASKGSPRPAWIHV